jgi:hypothetical protein
MDTTEEMIVQCFNSLYLDVKVELIDQEQCHVIYMGDLVKFEKSIDIENHNVVRLMIIANLNKEFDTRFTFSNGKKAYISDAIKQ